MINIQKRNFRRKVKISWTEVGNPMISLVDASSEDNDNAGNDKTADDDNE